MWLARFGRMVASDAVASVTARLETPRDAGSHVTVAGQRMNFGEAEGTAALATVLTGFAQTFGAPTAPAPDEDDPFDRHGLTNGWNDPATVTGARRVTGRELLLGTSFRAVLGQGAGRNGRAGARARRCRSSRPRCRGWASAARRRPGRWAWTTSGAGC